jgi:hypothetical protein
MNKSITHVAIIWGSKMYSLPKPFRHHHIIRARALLENPEKTLPLGNQGFLDEEGEFLNRTDALIRVRSINQPTTKYFDPRSTRLFSEDVWDTVGEWNAEPGTPELEAYCNTYSDVNKLKQLKIVAIGER